MWPGAASMAQATWIGYPNSTGLQAVDYRFTDAVCDPLDTTQVRCSDAPGAARPGKPCSEHATRHLVRIRRATNAHVLK